MTPITFTTDIMLIDKHEPSGLTVFTTKISEETMLKAIIENMGYAWLESEVVRLKQAERRTVDEVFNKLIPHESDGSKLEVSFTTKD